MFAIVTGASSGIGRAAARRLAGKGFGVLAVGRDAAALESVCREIGSEGGRAEPCIADVTTPGAPAAPVAPAPSSPTPAAALPPAPVPVEPRPQAVERPAPRVMDTLDLGTTSITGNAELPKVLYIVPWKKSDLGDLVGRPVNTLLDEVLAPVDPEVFERHLSYYDSLYGKQRVEE